MLAIILLASSGNKVFAQTGSAINLDGINDHVSCAGSTMGAFSIELWMRTTQTAPTGTQWYQGIGLVDANVAGVNNDYGISMLGNKAAFGTGNPDITITSTIVINDGNWHHIVGQYTGNPGNNMKLYVDGILQVNQNGASPNARNLNTNIAVGVLQTLTGYFNGEIDEVRVWNYLLSPCEINSRKNCELTMPQTGLLRYYTFNQGIAAGNNSTMTIVPNQVGGNNANIFGLALTGSTSNFIAPGAVVSGVSCNPLSTNVTGNGNNIADNATTTSTLNATNYGTVCTSAVPLTNIFTIQNNGTSSITLNTFTLTGANASSFSVSSVPPTSLAVGSTATFAITFSPSTSGPKVATLAFNTSDCAFSTYNFALNASVVAAPTIAVNSGSICSGNSFVIIPSGALTYTFSSGSATVGPNVTTSYTVVGTGSVGCPGTNSAISTVSVITTPTLTLSGANICNGQSFTLSPSGASTYTYLNGGPVITPSVTTTYSIFGSNGSCLSSNTAVATITVNITPTLVVSALNPTICSGISNTLSASGATSYTFNPGNILSPLAIVTPTSSTTYTVTGAIGNCNNTKTITIIVNPLPTLTATTNSTSICPGNSAILSANGASTYSWSNGSTTQSISISPTLTTNYTVTGTGINGCVNSTTITQIVSPTPPCGTITTIGINQIKALTVRVFPNPVEKDLIIETEVYSIVQLFNQFGQLVYESDQPNLNHQINLDGYQSGLYLVSVICDGVIKQVKFFKD